MRRAKAALFQWVKAPPGEMLQPEAPGATMEATKWLKPLGTFFETPDRAADRGFGQTEPIGHPRHVSSVGHGQKKREIIKADCF